MNEINHRSRKLLAFAAMIALWSAIAMQARGAESMALSGSVTSSKEAHMEGVLVSAKKVGGTITITVVTDNQGHYAFPSSKLAPGKYRMNIRAVGYDLADPGEVTVVANQTTQSNLKLNPASNLAAQLSDLEWLMSVPGTPEQKKLLNCTVSCHSPGVPLSAKYTAEQFMPVLHRMHNYGEGSLDVLDQVQVTLPNAFDAPANPADQPLAQYLSSVNLSSSKDGKWKYELQTLPRPKGRSTKVIITEYDMPRRSFEPHDVGVDADGIVWSPNFGGPSLLRLDPRTGEMKEWKLPVLRPNYPTAILDLQFDKEGNPWLAFVDQAFVVKFDKKTEQTKTYRVPEEFETPRSRLGMVVLSDDGKMWFKETSKHMVFKMDLKTNHVDSYVMPSEFYGMRLDSQGNLFLASMQKGTIGEINGKTGEISVWPTPTPDSGARRGEFDSHDRFWFGEFKAGKIGMFDTKSKQFKEWELPIGPFNDAYGAAPNKEGDQVWAGGMMTDYVYRLEPKTGQVTPYLLPSVEVNIRRVTVENTKNSSAVWIGENHQGKIAKLEFLD